MSQGISVSHERYSGADHASIQQTALSNLNNGPTVKRGILKTGKQSGIVAWYVVRSCHSCTGSFQGPFSEPGKTRTEFTQIPRLDAGKDQIDIALGTG